MFPLLMADKLGDYIVGTAIETIETEKLVSEFEKVVVDEVYNNDQPVETVIKNLQDYIKSKGIQVNTVMVEDAYISSDKTRENVHAYTSSLSVAGARSLLKEVRMSLRFELHDNQDLT